MTEAVAVVATVALALALALAVTEAVVGIVAVAGGAYKEAGRDREN